MNTYHLRLIVLSSVLVLIIPVTHVIVQGIGQNQTLDAPLPLATQLPTLSPTTQPTSTPTPTPDSGTFNQTIQNLLTSSDGNYSIALYNFETRLTYLLDEHHIYPAASLYKLWAMATAYQQIDAHILSEGQVYPQLKAMITVSDNPSATAVLNTIGRENVHTFLTENGLTNSSLGDTNTLSLTSAYDTYTFFDKLYKGALASPTSTTSMIELLKLQQLNEKLPRYLDGVTIAHKTGTLDSYSHDAGVVYSPNGEYIIVVLSQSTNPQKADNTIGLIAKAAYDFFNSN